MGALPLAIKGLGGSNKTAALSMISPALALGSALGGKKKKPAVAAAPTTSGPVAFGPSPSFGY